MFSMRCKYRCWTTPVDAWFHSMDKATVLILDYSTCASDRLAKLLELSAILRVGRSARPLTSSAGTRTVSPRILVTRPFAWGLNESTWPQLSRRQSATCCMTGAIDERSRSLLLGNASTLKIRSGRNEILSRQSSLCHSGAGIRE